MGRDLFSEDRYEEALRTFGVSSKFNVTREAEEQARDSGHLSELVDPAVDPIRRSLIRLNPHYRQWIATVGCPMDIEVSCDTTSSMGGEVDTEMAVLPEMYGAVAKVLPGYDPQLCLGIFGDVCDDFVLCRPQFEMEAAKIVRYLKAMAPQRDGGDSPEDPQYAMFARAYLTDAYTNRIGLKGYHFIVTDATCHQRINREEIERIFGQEIFENELQNMDEIPALKEVVQVLKQKTHQFILLLSSYDSCVDFWRHLCGDSSVIQIASTRQLPAVISAIIGLTEGTLDLGVLREHLSNYLDGDSTTQLIRQLSKIKIGAQAELRHQLPHPVPKQNDIFSAKGDLWPIQQAPEADDDSVAATADDEVSYL